MRVAFVHNLARGGARRVMSEHMRRLDLQTAEFCLQPATPVSNDPVVVALHPVARRLPSVTRPPARYWDLARLVLAWNELADLVNRWSPDVVMLHPCQFLQCPPVTRRLRGRVVYFCHEPRRVDYEPEAARRRNATRRVYAPLYRWERRYDRDGIASADTVLTNSHYTAQMILRAYGRKAHVLTLGVGDVFHSDQLEEPAARALSVGTLIASKGHDLAIRAVADSGTVRQVTVVAPRPDAAESARLAALAEEQGVGLEVQVAITDDELAALYRTSFATLYLARREPLGLASLEAQASGCPVIVAAEGGLPETINDGVSGIAVSRTAVDAAAALRLLDDRSRRAEMAGAAAERGRLFTWEASTRELETHLFAGPVD
jgi:glycosyltransferase involved in cell wall biosynthesis